MAHDVASMDISCSSTSIYLSLLPHGVVDGLERKQKNRKTEKERKKNT